MAVQVGREEYKGATRVPTNVLSRLWERVRHRERPGPLAKRRERWFYLMISPWIIGFVLLQAGPIIAAGLLAFANYNLTKGATWVGLQHFTTMLDDRLAGKTLWNTAYYSLGSVLPGMGAAFALANLLNQKIRGINLFRTIFFLPAVVSGIAVIMLWGWIFNPEFGLINAVLEWFGIRGPAWLQSETWAMPAMILMSLWGIGWMMLVYLAGLQGIPQELYEASEIDGASGWQKLRFITIPLLSPVTFFLLVTNLIASFQMFSPAYLLTRGGPNNATMTISLLIYFSAFQWSKLGYASALAMLLFMIVLLITLMQFGFARLWVYYETEMN